MTDARDHWSRRHFVRTVGLSAMAVVVRAGTMAAGQPKAAVDLRFGQAPTPMLGSDGSVHLAYELHVTARHRDFTLEHLSVFDGSASLLTYGPDDLEDRTMRPEAPRSARYGRVVRRDTTAVVSVWLSLPADRTRPRSLRHQLRGSDSEPVTSGDARVETAAPLVLGLPVREGLWLAHNGPGDHRAAHWGSMLRHRDRVTVPQRYAIDFMGLDARGRGVRGPLKDSANQDWPGFGRDVIAVADGIVLESRDGVTDNPPLFEPPPPTNVELPAIGGNYVLLDIGGGRYVHFLHLERSSVTAARGQRVRQGDVLGRVGNSGNTNGAHLHFNVVNGRRLETAEGLPYVFDRYITRGSTTASAAFGESPVEPATARDARQSIPINGAILQSARA